MMTRGKIIWVAGLALFYGAFWIWYGGNGTPLSVAEGRKMLDAVRAMHLAKGHAPPASDFRANMEAMIAKDDGREFYMVNLETRQKGVAAQQAEADYSAIVVPLLLKRGGFPVYVGDRAGLALGQYGQTIDRVAIVRYRSLRDLLAMNADPAMAKGAAHKFAALQHTEVFITRPTISAVTVRLTLALLLLAIGWVGCRGIEWVVGRRD